jgi:hypothetical protein
VDDEPTKLFVFKDACDGIFVDCDDGVIIDGRGAVDNEVTVGVFIVTGCICLEGNRDNGTRD